MNTSGWFDRRLTLNAVGFHVSYEDLQIQIFSVDPPTGAIWYIEANVEAKINGLEVAWQAVPFDNVRIGGSVGWLDAFYISGTGTAGLGKKLEYAPEWQYSLYDQYEHSFDDLVSITARAEMTPPK